MVRPRRLQLLLAIAVPVVAMALLAGGAAAIEFQEVPTPITRSTGEDLGSVDMAVGTTDDLYAVWQDGRFASFQAGDAILFAYSDSDSRGREWNDTIRLPASLSNADQWDPAIAVGPDGVIHVVWQERSNTDDTPGGPFWEVRYTRSLKGGLDWSDPVRVSRPTNSNNTEPDVAALSKGSAFVAWTLRDHPGTSVALAHMVDGDVEWVREDFALADDGWEHNGQASLATDEDGGLHAAWASRDVDAMLAVLGSQVFYRFAPEISRTSALPAAVPLADDPFNWTHGGPSLALTKRHGAWVTWVRSEAITTVTGDVTFLADSVVKGKTGEDIHVATLTASPRATPMVDSVLGPDDSVVMAISGVGSPPSPPLYTSTCTVFGCFADPTPVIPVGGTIGLNASIAADSLGNVYVGWDEGDALLCTQRRNSQPGPPDLLLPDLYAHDETPDFVWSFNDPDAGSSQSAFWIVYSPDPSFKEDVQGGVVTGAQGRSNRYTAPVPIEEGIWYWNVRTRDHLGLWSDWATNSDFLADRTPPTGTVVINGGDDITHQRVVVLTLNASDNLEDVAPEMYFQISSDPNFPNASKHEWPPPNHQVNQELPPGEGVKVVFFRVFDASGLHYTAMDNILYNETPLVIVHTSVTQAPAAKPLNISCEILLAKDVTATLFHRRAGREEYNEIEMSSNGTTYWAVIPKDKVSQKGLEYYIRAKSSSGTVTSPAGNPVEEPYEVEVYETTDQYEPPIFYPTATFLGAAVVLLLLFLVYWFRIRE